MNHNYVPIKLRPNLRLTLKTGHRLWVAGAWYPFDYANPFESADRSRCYETKKLCQKECVSPSRREDRVVTGVRRGSVQDRECGIHGPTRQVRGVVHLGGERGPSLKEVADGTGW